MKCIVREKRPRKSPGMDNVKKIALKYIPYKGILFFSCIINSCIKLQYFSQIKIFERVIKTKLLKTISKNTIIPNNPYGFRQFNDRHIGLYANDNGVYEHELGYEVFNKLRIAIIIVYKYLNKWKIKLNSNSKSSHLA
uniref:Uncharacterized protein n=1 Tax=Glossina morsitans morsitans TaxID=37546 RepID=A0A1B0GDC9_GLOMM